MQRKASPLSALNERIESFRRLFVDLRKTEPDALLAALQEEVGHEDPRFLSMEVPVHLCPSLSHRLRNRDEEESAALIGSFRNQETPSSFPSVDDEFRAEVELLRNKRRELGRQESANSAKPGNAQSFDILDSANAADAALADWDTYALPYRLRDGLIVEIRSPTSWASLHPTITPYSADRFLAWITRECALLSARAAQLKAQRRLLSYAVALLTGILILRW